MLHLYRPTAVVDKSTAAESASVRPDTNKLCVLAVPCSVPVSDFCSFMGATVEHVSEMRILRDERAAGSSKEPGDYTVLLTFNSAASAEEFHKYYNGREARSLTSSRRSRRSCTGPRLPASL